MSDHGLGRIYRADPRDLDAEELHRRLFLNGPSAAAIPTSVLWPDAVVLDQGDYGTCVGNGWAGFGISDPVDDAWTETDARAIYFEATVIDGHPDDPDKPAGGQQGSTVRSGAKAMQKRTRISAYGFTTSLDVIREWLASHGPVVIGSDWTNDMFNPGTDGFVRPTGGVAGGHCFLLIGYDLEADSFRFRNSWGAGWGLAGDFLMKSADLATILKGIESPGEACTATELPLPPVPDPTPTPDPVPPAPAPGPPPKPPAPTPIPPSVIAELKLIWRAFVKAMDALFRRFE